MSIESLVARDRFLPDLHARLSAFRICLPPLRRLVGGPFSAHHGRNNLRQLSATMHRLLVDAEGASMLTLEHCLDDLAYLNDGASGRRPPLTKQAIDQAVTRARSIVGAARLLGVDRTTIYRFLRHRASRVADSSVGGVLHVG